MAEVFADGEPVDPAKLQALQTEIIAIKNLANQAFNLSSKNLDDGSQKYVYVTQAGNVSFTNIVGSASPQTAQIDVSWPEGEFDEINTVVTAKNKDSKADPILVTLTGTDRQPTIAVYHQGPKTAKKAELKVFWVSVGRKLITE